MRDVTSPSRHERGTEERMSFLVESPAHKLKQQALVRDVKQAPTFLLWLQIAAEGLL
jgi:hypothetical protein